MRVLYRQSASDHVVRQFRYYFISRRATALTYARQHLSLPLSVAALTNAAFLSPRQFSRLFRRETGQSPARAIERRRAESARLTMEAGRFSSEKIAWKHGFGNRVRMRRSFVRAFGPSPQEIQRTASALIQQAGDPKPESRHQNSLPFDKTSLGIGVFIVENMTL